MTSRQTFLQHVHDSAKMVAKIYKSFGAQTWFDRFFTVLGKQFCAAPATVTVRKIDIKHEKNSRSVVLTSYLVCIFALKNQVIGSGIPVITFCLRK